MLIAPFREGVPSIPDFDAPAWRGVPVAAIDRTWRGEAAPAGLETAARLVWTAEALWVGFTCGFTELDVDATFDPTAERYALWERDVCETFIQSPREPSAVSYKEFEVAPTGQWFDVAIRTPRLEVDWSWNGGIRTVAAIDHRARLWRAVLRVPFDAFGVAPRHGDRWRANLFRIGRVGGVRHFLACAPTYTPAPDFHVPAAFIPLVFEGSPA